MTVFDPERGRPIVAPPCAGPGCWAGAPGAFCDERERFLVYRLRRPHPSRGYELRIAASHDDGARYETIWSAGEDALAAESIERCALVRDGAQWRLYVSYVSRDDRRWRIGVLEAAAVDAFDAASVVPALTVDAADAAAVKDPWLRRAGEEWLMFVSYGPLPSARGSGLHVTGDGAVHRRVDRPLRRQREARGELRGAVRPRELDGPASLGARESGRACDRYGARAWWCPVRRDQFIRRRLLRIHARGRSPRAAHIASLTR